MSIAWVTGGGTGIGKALAQALIRDGWRVAISGRREDVLKQAAQELGDVLAIPGDASDPAAINRSVTAIRERWGDVDLLVNNAGVNPMHRFQEAQPEEFMETYRINCQSAILCTKAVLTPMISRRSGAIVNVSSILGKWASPRSSAYTVSKFALTGFTDTLRQELSGTGIHVMGVYPGFIRTAMTEPFVKKGSPRERMGSTPEMMATAIMKGLRKKKREVSYPWYVPLVLRVYLWMPGFLESIRHHFDP